MGANDNGRVTFFPDRNKLHATGEMTSLNNIYPEEQWRVWRGQHDLSLEDNL
jgi:hypothetical protein